jgi:hypothetical protein
VRWKAKEKKNTGFETVAETGHTDFVSLLVMPRNRISVKRAEKGTDSAEPQAAELDSRNLEKLVVKDTDPAVSHVKAPAPQDTSEIVQEKVARREPIRASFEYSIFRRNQRTFLSLQYLVSEKRKACPLSC